jgi:hypothetical protein
MSQAHNKAVSPLPSYLKHKYDFRGEHIGRVKILFLVTEDRLFWSYCLSLARKVRDAGAERKISGSWLRP